MKKFILSSLLVICYFINSAQVSIYAGISDVRTNNYSTTCPSLGLSIDHFYVSAFGNLKSNVPILTTGYYNVFGGNVGYKLWITRKLKIIPSIGITSSREMYKNDKDYRVQYYSSQHYTNWGITFQRQINNRLEFGIGFNTVERLKFCLVYNLKKESVYK